VIKLLHAIPKTPSNSTEELLNACFACLKALWPVGTKRASAEHLLDCLGVSLETWLESTPFKVLEDVISMLGAYYNDSLAKLTGKRRVSQRCIGFVLVFIVVRFALTS
jgi:hypothetical protein